LNKLVGAKQPDHIIEIKNTGSMQRFYDLMALVSVGKKNKFYRTC